MDNLPAITAQQSAVWSLVDPAKELRQGEVITALIRHDYASGDDRVDAFEVPLAIIFSQDCDLLGDFTNRSAGGDGELDHVLVMRGYTVEEVKAITKFGSKEMKPLHQNQNPRWHYMEACPASCDAASIGFGGLVVDFRSVLALPAAEIYYQCSDTAQRRSMLNMPYREHFQSRAAQFMSRIVLPTPHQF